MRLRQRPAGVRYLAAAVGLGLLVEAGWVFWLTGHIDGWSFDLFIAVQKALACAILLLGAAVWCRGAAAEGGEGGDAV